MPRRDADDDARAGERAAAAQHLAHEVAQHLGGDVVVGDHAVLQRPDGLDVAGRAADHPLGLGPDGDDGVGGGVDGDDRRLVEHDAAAAGVDEGVRGAEVDREVAAEQVAAALGDQRQARASGVNVTAEPFDRDRRDSLRRSYGRASG